MVDEHPKIAANRKLISARADEAAAYHELIKAIRREKTVIDRLSEGDGTPEKFSEIPALQAKLKAKKAALKEAQRLFDSL